MMTKPVAISTFSGCGGSSMGLRSAGFDVRVALEFMPKARETYLANSPSTKVLDSDIRKLTGKDLLEAAGVKAGELDLLEGSPPCASFSRGSTKGHKKWGEVKKYSKGEQRTDDLFFEFLRVAKDVRPRAMVMENVKGLTMGRAKAYLHAIIREIKAMGYRADVRVYNAAHFGTPQARERVIFVCLRDDVKGEYVPPTPEKPITLREAWKDVPAPGEHETVSGYGPGTKMGVLAEMTPPGKQMVHAHKKLFGNESAYMHRRLSYDLPSPTLTTHPTYVHPEETRCITIPETKRICGFPDDFKLTGSSADRFERLGRAVPPPLYDRIGRQIIKALDE